MLYFSRWKTIGIWAVVLLGVLFALPNVIPASMLAKMPSWLPKSPMTLGLDLQGGSHILLKIDQNDLIKDRLNTVRDEIRTQLRDAKIGYTGLSGSGKIVQVRIRDAAQIDAAKEALKSLTSPVSAGLFTGGSVTEWRWTSRSRDFCAIR
jgi:SecD/SecF fusion protein